MIKKVIDIVIDSDDANKDVNNLTKDFEKLESQAKDAAKEGKDVGTDISKGAKKGAGGLKILSKGFKAVGVALKAAGIGLIVAVLGAMFSALSQNQKVLDAFTTAMDTVAIVMGDVVDVISDVIKSVSESSNGFEALGKVIKGLITLALVPMKLNFYAIKLAIQEAQLIWEKSFFGDNDPESIKTLNAAIDETKTALKEVAEDGIQAGKDIVNNFSEAATSVSDVVSKTIDEVSNISVKASYDQAKSNTAIKNTAALAIAENKRLLEQYDRKAEIQRQIRDDETKSFEERKKANEELGKILEEQSKMMVKNADLAIEAARRDVASNNSIENRVKLTEAQAEKEAILAQVEGFRSEQKINDIALTREQQSAEAERQSALLEYSDQIEISEIEKLERQKQRDIEEIERLKGNEELKAKIIADYDKKILALKAASAAEQRKRDKEEQEFKINAVSTGFKAIALLAGESTKLGKAAASAAVVMDAARAVVATWAGYGKYGFMGVGPAVAQSAFITATAIKSLRQINSSDKSQSISAGGSFQPRIGDDQQAQSPNFNIVGGSVGNQIAEALGQQGPVKAYVVSNEVSTQQALDRRIRNNAEL